MFGLHFWLKHEFEHLSWNAMSIDKGNPTMALSQFL